MKEKTLTFVGAAATSVLMGVVISLAWQWFVSPLLKVGSLPLPVGIVVGIVGGMLTHRYDKTAYEPEDDYEKINRALDEILSPLFSLGLLVILYFVTR